MTAALYLELGFVLIAAAAVSACLIVALRPLLQRYALARPNARSSHTLPTPQGGGIAVVASVIAVTVLAYVSFGIGLAGLTPLWFLLIAMTLMAIVGAVDDIRTIEVLPRLLLQALLVGVALAAIPSEFTIFGALPWWIERALWLIAGLWFVNLVNFMDGLDWMTVAETVPLASGLVLIGLTGALPDHAIVAATALVGAMLGFAPFNRPVARLFLGDVGSLPIGLLLGWMLALLAIRGHLAAALLLPLYYLADATVTLMRRIAHGARPWEAHRTHFYQRATTGGFSVGQVIARVFIVNVALVVLAAISVWMPSRTVEGITLALGAALVTGLLIVFARGRR